jgi:CYTH domain-containing protein
MSPASTVRVRVKGNRALSLATDNGTTTLYGVGDEFELPADEAEALELLGYVEPADSAKQSAASLGDELH